MKTLYLIRGVPGSGKSSFALQLWEFGVVDRVMEADQYFTDDSGERYNFDATKLGAAHMECQRKTVNALVEGFNVAVANTSTTEKEVEVYRKIAHQCGAVFVSIVVENRNNTKSIHDVPEEKIQQMRSKFSIKL